MIEDPLMVAPFDSSSLHEFLTLTEALSEISFHTIAGTTHPQTFCVMAKLQNKAVTILIDDGNTHNFIDQAVVTKFGLSVTCDQPLQVMVANQDKIDRVGCCLGLTLLIQDLPVRADFNFLPVAAC